jgi:V/A-type H+-transporting ATPase subunit A
MKLIPTPPWKNSMPCSRLILTWNDKAQEALLAAHVHLDKIVDMPIREQIGRMRYIVDS